MLARLAMKTARLLDVHIELSTIHDENALVIDLAHLCARLPLIPENAWQRIGRSCSRAFVPMCTNVHRMISRDLESVAQLLLELELQSDDAFRGVPPVGLLSDSRGGEDVGSSNECPARKRPRSNLSQPIVISRTHSSSPTIVITLAPRQAQETSCRIPYQDQAFGNLLTVPSHPAFNKVHPPMIPDPCALPQFDGWKWHNGHWEAVLPTLNDQRRQGMYSKAIISRKRSCLSVKATPRVG
ncbi:hypothetical protein M413DRAFT_204502 [Hebeloma cylindrosporum]|uniref:Uncharacterized protein n=1 Tax=Hebeloma cylindrosporum TaxID=76867 RepID=A0A0C3CFT5_HEBCY|nr:hypothetical protein M413DRAFT_204502 [Hebeloma cylindrosporum h7]